MVHINKQTVVWVANQDLPLINATTGAFGFAKDGNLQVLDASTEKAHWYSERYYSCDPCNTTDTIVNLTDSGNLVLYGYPYESSNVTSLWESFENPTDTFLPGMLLRGDMNLTSWRDRDDPGSGSFTFMLDTAGSQNAIIVNKEGTIYWKRPGWIYTLVSTREGQTSCNFKNARLVINFSGKIEYWEQSTNGTWSLVYAMPRDNCSVYNVCGKFGSCNLHNYKLAC